MCRLTIGDKIVMVFLAVLAVMGFIALEVCVEELLGFSAVGLPFIQHLLCTDTSLSVILGTPVFVYVFMTVAISVLVVSVLLLYDTYSFKKEQYS